MKRHITTKLLTLTACAVACLWAMNARAERIPVDFITISGERVDATTSGSNRLQVSWEFTAETDSLRLTEEDRSGAIITALYEVRLFDWGDSPAAVIPNSIIDPDEDDNVESSVTATIFFNNEDFLVMRENALMFSLDASDFDIVSAYGTGDVTGRFSKKISGVARIENPIRSSIRSLEIVITEVFLYLPTDQDE